MENDLIGSEYFWESGAFVIYRIRPQEPFPEGYQIFNIRSGVVELSEAPGLETFGAKLLKRMRDEGVPIVDDISIYALDVKQPVLDCLSGKIPREQFESVFAEARRRTAEIDADIRAKHFERHPEQRQGSVK